MNKIKKYIFNMLLFVFLIWLTFKILFSKQDMGDLYRIIESSNKLFLFGSICAMFIYCMCEAFNLLRTLKRLDANTTYVKCLKYAFIGVFFSAITPAASGGQPMQVYYMHKDGLDIGHSSLALLINLASFQIVTILMALISLIFYHSYLSIGLRIFFVIGVGLNMTALVLLLISIISKRLSNCLVNFVIKVMKKLKLRKLDHRIEKLKNSLENYQVSAKYIRNNIQYILKTIGITIVQMIVYYTIPYYAYRAIGLNGESYIKILGLQSMLYATVSGIPSPGAVGVTEGAFVTLFGAIIPNRLLNGAVLLNRGISFYLMIIISSVVVMVATFFVKRQDSLEIGGSKQK